MLMTLMTWHDGSIHTEFWGMGSMDWMQHSDGASD
jgi:hypothetical protein